MTTTTDTNKEGDNLNYVDIADAKQQAREYMAENIPFYFHGKPGVGKSDAVKQLADEQKIGFIDLRLGQLDAVDLRGLPFIVKDEGKDGKPGRGKSESHWARPDFWPQVERDGERGIILFDEMSDTNKTIQSAAYQIILNRRIGPHVLPPGWFPCAAGNRREDKAAAQQLSSALANRFAHIHINPSAPKWCEWALENGIRPEVIGFIRARPGLIHDMSGANLYAFPTPRTWAQVSRVVDRNPDLRLRLVQGLVGPGAAGEFEAAMKTMDLPDVDEVLKDPARCRIPKEPAAKYAMACMLSLAADRGNFAKLTKYTARNEFGRDYNICMVVDAARRDSSLTDTPAFVEFANKNTDLQLG